MKRLIEYINEISPTSQEIDMKPPHIMADQNNGNEALWNTTEDRWSRKAKHHLNLPAKAAIVNDWERGDIAIYEGQEVEISIPKGPNASVGIIVDGRTRMVREHKLTKIKEGVMGGMQPLNPINRMMQLAGISSPTIMEPTVAEEAADDHVSKAQKSPQDPDEFSEIVAEADASQSSIQKLIDSAEKLPQFSGNREAARLYAIGGILSAMSNEIKANPPQTVIGQQHAKELSTIALMGVDLIKAAQDMAKAAK
jgi:hypothetical protein